MKPKLNLFGDLVTGAITAAIMVTVVPYLLPLHRATLIEYFGPEYYLVKFWFILWSGLLLGSVLGELVTRPLLVKFRRRNDEAQKP